MRPLHIVVIGLTLISAAPSFADDSIVGTYDVKFEEAATTCTAPPTKLATGKLAISVKKRVLTVVLDGRYPMTGALPKDGAIAAKTTKLIGTSVGGLSARYSITGKVEGGALELVLTAQYVRQDTNKPYCAQTWNAKGSRTEAAKKAKP